MSHAYELELCYRCKEYAATVSDPDVPRGSSPSLCRTCAETVYEHNVRYLQEELKRLKERAVLDGIKVRTA